MIKNLQGLSHESSPPSPKFFGRASYLNTLGHFKSQGALGKKEVQISSTVLGIKTLTTTEIFNSR